IDRGLTAACSSLRPWTPANASASCGPTALRKRTFCTIGRLAASQDGLSGLLEGDPVFAGATLEGGVGSLFAEAGLHQAALGALNQLAGLQAVAQLGDLAHSRLALGESRYRYLDRGSQVAVVDGFDQIALDGKLGGFLEQVLLAKGREDDNGYGPRAGDDL